MEKGAAKSSWNQNGNDLAREVAAIINTKPDEPWLVIYLKGACGGAVPDMVRGLIDTDPDRVHFLNWGKHQGTNDFRDISNVILAGTQFYAEAQYEMMARYCTNLPKDQGVPQAVIDQVKMGEHSNHILQALCRSSVRKSNGASCGPCNAYIIASKASGIRGLLSTIFPGCKIKPWRPAKKKLRGQVGMAVAYVEGFFAENPDGVLPLPKLRGELEITNASNFNRRVRNHPDFKAALEEMQIEEVSMGAAKYPNALAKTAPVFSPIPGSSYIAIATD